MVQMLFAYFKPRFAEWQYRFCIVTCLVLQTSFWLLYAVVTTRGLNLVADSADTLIQVWSANANSVLSGIPLFILLASPAMARLSPVFAPVRHAQAGVCLTSILLLILWTSRVGVFFTAWWVLTAVVLPLLLLLDLLQTTRRKERASAVWSRPTGLRRRT